MPSLVMTLEERQAFLAESHIGVLAVERAGRSPLAVPVWYDYEPGGEVVIWIARGSVKHRSISQAGRFSFLVQQEEPPYKYVTAEGPAVIDTEPPARAQVLKIVRRYESEDEAAAYLDSAPEDAAMILVRMRPQKWLSTDYSKEAAAES
ncbi:pyridoxamine 5'-phosphate oxidase family protein [Kribbella speibonae]|uniref:Pyridoxamine 5'-phosphate oxidase n=1 Tax=Kribbella speibonae TaxID=1572660 RepID=A0A4R0IV61_9ACTN|nr:pyridoxamine 5'-phosphate oxidase family protein [Kribbella speibonae]TCC36434.1 pyridoxamine 5'-phosphate oxidase [Kribbella speibonae]